MCTFIPPVKNRPAVYIIRNKITKDWYVGRTIMLKNRLHQHRNALRHPGHHSRKLQKDWDKYGEANFEVDVILADIGSIDLIEHKYLKKLPPYNTNGKNKGGYDMSLVPFSTRLPEELAIKLKVYAIKKGISVQEALKQIIESHLEKEKSK